MANHLGGAYAVSFGQAGRKVTGVCLASAINIRRLFSLFSTYSQIWLSSREVPVRIARIDLPGKKIMLSQNGYKRVAAYAL
jgi:hypothetical protein